MAAAFRSKELPDLDFRALALDRLRSLTDAVLNLCLAGSQTGSSRHILRNFGSPHHFVSCPCSYSDPAAFRSSRVRRCDPEPRRGVLWSRYRNPPYKCRCPTAKAKCRNSPGMCRSGPCPSPPSWWEQHTSLYPARPASDRVDWPARPLPTKTKKLKRMRKQLISI